VEKCFVPSEANVPDRLQQAFGEVAEMFVKAHYCPLKGGCHEFLTADPLQTDFFDIAMGFSRCRHLGAYLKLHNPDLDEILLVSQCEGRKDSHKHFPVADIITHEPPDRTEFYEIKPNSPGGKSKGRDKIVWFEIICDDEDLPYVAGTLYDPDERKLVWDATWFGHPTKVFFHWFREQDGLLVYELCFQVSLENFAEALVKLLIRAVVAALIVLMLPVVAGGAVLAQAEFLTSPLAEPVGPEEANAPGDVAYAQLLLNDWRGRNGFGLIEVDGQFDSLGSAITDFQEAQGFETDGRLEPGGAAIRAVELDHFAGLMRGAEAGELVADVTLPPEPELISEPSDEEEDPVEDVASLDVESAIAEVLQAHLDDLRAAAEELVG
jgi:hypothetical protein